VPPDVYAQRTFLPDRRRDRGVVTGRTRARVDRAVHQLGRKASGIVADAADLGAMDALMGTVRDRHGRLDSLFANAGTGTFLPFENITEPDFDHGIDVDFKGVLFTVQKALPLPADGGSIVINAPWTLHRGNSVLTLYSATRAAVHNLARTLAASLAPRGIRVNSVSPGYIDTPMYPAAALTTAEAQAIIGGPPAALGPPRLRVTAAHRGAGRRRGGR